MRIYTLHNPLTTVSEIRCERKWTSKNFAKLIDRIENILKRRAQCNNVRGAYIYN
jgi:hypothetical protein